MVKPDLELVEASDDGLCGAPTSDGTPCELPAGEDGRCWLEAHQEHPAAADDSLPDPPDHLDEIGREEWWKRVEQLDEFGVLHSDDVDLGLLEQACEMYEGRRQCQKAVRDHGQLVPGRNGVKKNPASSKQLKYAKEWRLCMKELREQVREAEPEGDEDEFDPLADY